MEIEKLCSMNLAVCAFIVVLTRCISVSTSEFENHHCSSFVNVTQYSTSGAELFIPNKEGPLQTNPISCVYNFSFTSYISAIKVSMSMYDYQGGSNPCSDNILKIRLYLHNKDGYSLKPVKELDCFKAAEWDILWPWREVVMEILIKPSSVSFVLQIEPTFPFSDHMQYKPYRKEVKLPQKSNSIYQTVPKFCLGNYYYDVIYKRYYGSTLSKVKFRLEEKSICIKTRSSSSFFTDRCLWKIYLKVNDRVIMVLRCEDINKYWCLPEQWFEEMNEYLEIDFAEVSSYLYLEYKITVTANSSVSGLCPLTTTLSYNRRTTTDWVYTNNNNDYDSTSSSAAGAIVPVVGLVAFVCVFICCASYIRTKRRNAQSSRDINNFSHIAGNQNNSYTVDDVRNPAYRSHDAVRGPGSTETTAPPPNYFQIGVAENSPPSELPDDTAALPSYGEVTNPTESVPSVPPPSYEDALNIIQQSNATNSNISRTDYNF